LIENIEAEVGTLSETERELVERELDLLAMFSQGLVGRLPSGGTSAQQQEAITELLHEDPELFATFSQLMEVSRSNHRASPMRSVKRLKQELGEAGGAP
jgi:hypothetical protein